MNNAYTHILEYVAKVSLDRASAFLLESELLDSFLNEAKSPSSMSLPAEDDHLHDDEEIIGFKNANFSWSNDNLATSSRTYKLRIEGELLFKRNCINLIVGPT